MLMVLDHFNFGGAENLMAELGNHKPALLEIAVSSLAPPGGDSDVMLTRLTEAGLHPTYLSVRRLLDPIGFLKLVRTFRRVDADVIHAHLGYSATLVPLAARLAGKPVVATLHLSPQRHTQRREWIKERLSVRIPAHLGRLVMISQSVLEEYARLHGPARPNWTVIPNGVDLDRYSPRRAPCSANRPVWAAVAALRPDKNHIGLVRAWAGVVAVHPGATLLIVGDGPSRPDIERVVSEAGLEGSVRLLGRRDDVPDILGSVDGVVSASVDEALPTALIEAAACGLPVVAADAGGTREIVTNGVTGRVVPVRDVSALTEALLDTIGDPERAAQYGAAGRTRVEEKYSMTAWADLLARLYEEVIGEHA